MKYINGLEVMPVFSKYKNGQIALVLYRFDCPYVHLTKEVDIDIFDIEHTTFLDTNLLGGEPMRWLMDNDFGTMNFQNHKVGYAFYAGFTFTEDVLKKYTAQKVFKHSKHATKE